MGKFVCLFYGFFYCVVWYSSKESLLYLLSFPPSPLIQIDANNIYDNSTDALDFALLVNGLNLS